MHTRAAAWTSPFLPGHQGESLKIGHFLVLPAIWQPQRRLLGLEVSSCAAGLQELLEEHRHPCRAVCTGIVPKSSAALSPPAATRVVSRHLSAPLAIDMLIDSFQGSTGHMLKLVPVIIFSASITY